VIEGCVGDEGAGRLRTHADRPRRARGPGAPAIGIVAIQPTRAEPSPRAARAETILTPVTQSVPSPPRWCRGDDGRVHMQYELLLTNTVPLLVDVTTLAVRGDGRSIETLSADQLAAAMTSSAARWGRPHSRPRRSRSFGSTSFRIQAGGPRAGQSSAHGRRRPGTAGRADDPRSWMRTACRSYFAS
jgi:hypothetical protein